MSAAGSSLSARVGRGGREGLELQEEGGLGPRLQYREGRSEHLPSSSSCRVWGTFTRTGYDTRGLPTTTTASTGTSQQSRCEGGGKPKHQCGVPKGRSSGTVVQGPARISSGRSKARRVRAAKGSCQAALSASLGDPPVFLEIFSGGGRLGKAIARTTGWPVLLWDIKLGDEYDLTQLANQQKILGWMRSGNIRGGHAGTPCNNFSRARDRPRGPPPLRSDQQPLGLPNLKSKDAFKVRVGSNLMRFSVKIMNLALALFIPFTLENPRTSRLGAMSRGSQTAYTSIPVCRDYRVLPVWVCMEEKHYVRCRPCQH